MEYINKVAVIGAPGRVDFLAELLLMANGFAAVGFEWEGERDVTVVPASCIHPVTETQEHEISTGHWDGYPHTPGTLYDCPDCESECFCGEMGLCIFCCEVQEPEYVKEEC